MTNQIRLSLFSAVIGATFAVAPHVAVADTFEWKGAGSTFLADLSTNYIRGASVPEGILQRLDNSDKKYLPMISGEDLLFRLTKPDGTYDYIHVFTNATGTLELGRGYVIKDATLLVVGGGGAGGICGGGGGGGGFIKKIFTGKENLVAGQYPVKIGMGGKWDSILTKNRDPATGKISRDGDGNQWNSVIMWRQFSGTETYFSGDFNHDGAIADDEKILSLGGGAGASASLQTGLSGASGGGGRGLVDTNTGRAGGKGTAGQGHDGASATPTGNNAYYNGGGGGAGAPANGATGGDGLASTIFGFEVWFAGGGGGAQEHSGSSKNGAGGKGGGNGSWAGTNAGHGLNGTGGGGGAAGGQLINVWSNTPGNGGDGIVIIRYSGEPKPTGFFIHIR